MTKLFEETRAFVEESFKGRKSSMLHFDRTVYWVKQLKPAADGALLVAAVGHDVERAFRAKDEGFNRKEKRFTDTETLKYHQEKGAEILGDFLAQNGASSDFIKRVKHLVSRHEWGGDGDQNVLKDADSLSFLENQKDSFLSKFDEQGYEKIREKFDWMYDRISSPLAKQLAEPYYKKMITDLDKIR